VTANLGNGLSSVSGSGLVGSGEGGPADATGGPPGSAGTGMGSVMDRLQPLDCHVSVELGRGKRSVTE
jgi:hypothetical protein